MKHYGKCSECQTPLISPKSGYVVCPNCGLVDYDYQTSDRSPFFTFTKVKRNQNEEFKVNNLKRWDRVSYREARSVYIKRYYQAIFGQYVSQNILDVVSCEVIKELDRELQNPKDRRNWHLEARFMKILPNYVNRTYIDRVFGQSEELAKKISSFETPKAKRRNSWFETLQMIDKIAESLKSASSVYEKYAIYAKVIYKRYFNWFTNYKLENRAVICMAFAERSYAKSKISSIPLYAEVMNVDKMACQRGLKKFIEYYKTRW